jgi:peptidoglycan/xylan/chitin deacetylase (PgdA/CDA1 family)
MNNYHKILLTFTILVATLLLIVACQSPATPTPTSIEPVQPTQLITSPTSTDLPKVYPTPTAMSTTAPTQTQPPILQGQSRDKVRQVMVNYGHVDQRYLSDVYWHRLDQNIEKYGKAQKVTVFEYHGDEYNMFKGIYAMTPESFARDMEWLMKNDYHFVTGAEMWAFLDGQLDLPKRSVFLTTDSGSGSDRSMARIIALYQNLEDKYGYPPHMNSYIWTMNMDSNEDPKCKQDACWQIYRDALDSGYFTIGTHTESHADFSTFTVKQTQYDLSQSISDIQTNLGLRVYAITWPFEACSPHHQTLADLGIKYAFGGWTRQPLQLYAYQNDDMPLCLPRLFPPNPNGVSGRPGGLTLIEILERGALDTPLK